MRSQLLITSLLIAISASVGYLTGYLNHTPTQFKNQPTTQECVTQAKVLSPSSLEGLRQEQQLEYRYSEEAKSCDCEQIQCEGTTTAQNSSSFLQLFTGLLNDSKFNEAMNLYNTVWGFSQQDSAPLRAQLIHHLKTLSGSDSNAFTELANLYLGDYYDDIDVLSLLSMHYASWGQPYEALNTLQLSASYALNERDKDLTIAQLEKVLAHIDAKLSQDQSWSELIGLYEFAVELGFEQYPMLYRLAELYVHTGNSYQATPIIEKLSADPAWRDKVAELSSSQNMSPPQTASTSDYASSVALVRKANQYLAPIYFSGVKTQLLLDTGASTTVLVKSYFDQISDSLSLKHVAKRQFHTANGVVEADVFIVNEIQLGEFSMQNMEIAVLDYPSPEDSHGLLGMNVLQYFRFDIDQEKSVLRLQKR